MIKTQLGISSMQGLFDCLFDSWGTPDLCSFNCYIKFGLNIPELDIAQKHRKFISHFSMRSFLHYFWIVLLRFDQLSSKFLFPWEWWTTLPPFGLKWTERAEWMNTWALAGSWEERAAFIWLFQHWGSSYSHLPCYVSLQNAALWTIYHSSSRSLKTAGGLTPTPPLAPVQLWHIRDTHQSWNSHLQLFVYSISVQRWRMNGTQFKHAGNARLLLSWTHTSPVRMVTH